eukprot:4289753-Ditylum_brightwellii.AAC.1
MSGADVFQVFACEWRCNEKFIFKSVFDRKRTTLKRRFAIAPVALKYISNNVIRDVKANTICAGDDSCVEISDDVAFIRSVIEVSIKTLFQFVRKTSVRSGHEFEKKIPFPTCILGTLHGLESLNTELIHLSTFERMIRPFSKKNTLETSSGKTDMASAAAMASTN